MPSFKTGQTGPRTLTDLCGVESTGYWDNAMIRSQSWPLTQSAGFDSCHVGMTKLSHFALVNSAQPGIKTSAKLRTANGALF
jgi:hypothetical protein